MKFLLAIPMVIAIFFGSTGHASSPTYKANPVSVNISSQHVKSVNVSQTPVSVTPSSNVYQQKAATVTPTPIVTAPQVKQSTVTAPVSVNNGDKCYDSSCLPDPNRPYFDGFGNEFDYLGNLMQYSSECVDPISGQINPENPSCSQASSCAPNATSQDPCKLGQCFGYPYGICESNPNQGELPK